MAAHCYSLHYYMTPPCIHLDQNRSFPPPLVPPLIRWPETSKVGSYFPFPFPLGWVGWAVYLFFFSFILGFEIADLFDCSSIGLFRGEEARAWSNPTSIQLTFFEFDFDP